MLFESWQTIRPVLGAVRATYHWIKSKYAPPCPHFIKQATILRHSWPDSVFIETGTYKGATSRYFRRRGYTVATIEVYKPLFDAYSPYLRKLGVNTRLGDSAEVMPQVLCDYGERPAYTIFLDGHYSSGITGQGELAVPIVKEFQALRDFALAYPGKNVAVVVDDVRLFMPGGDPSYPAKSTLLEFATSISADWKIENDMFVCLRPCIR